MPPVAEAEYTVHNVQLKRISDAYYVLYLINMSDRVFAAAGGRGPSFWWRKLKRARNQNASQKRKQPSICGALCERVHHAVRVNLANL
jgi:hypothetical protein